MNDAESIDARADNALRSASELIQDAVAELDLDGDFAATVHREGAVPEPESSGPTGRSRWLGIAAGLVGLVVGGTVLAFTLGGGDGDADRVASPGGGPSATSASEPRESEPATASTTATTTTTTGTVPTTVTTSTAAAVPAPDFQSEASPFDFVTLQNGVVTWRSSDGSINATVELPAAMAGVNRGLVAATSERAVLSVGTIYVIVRPGDSPEVVGSEWYTAIGPVTADGYWAGLADHNLAERPFPPSADQIENMSMTWSFYGFDGTVTPGPTTPFAVLSVGEIGGELAVWDRNGPGAISIARGAALDTVASGGPLFVTSTHAYVFRSGDLVQVNVVSGSGRSIAELDGLVTACTLESGGASTNGGRIAVLVKNDITYDEHRLVVVELATGDLSIYDVPDGCAMNWIDDRQVMITDGVAPYVVDTVDGSITELDVGTVDAIPVMQPPDAGPQPG